MSWVVIQQNVKKYPNLLFTCLITLLMIENSHPTHHNPKNSQSGIYYPRNKQNNNLKQQKPQLTAHPRVDSKDS